MLLGATLVLNFVAYLILLISGATGALGGFVTSIMYVRFTEISYVTNGQR